MLGDPAVPHGRWLLGRGLNPLVGRPPVGSSSPRSGPWAQPLAGAGIWVGNWHV